MSKDDPDIAQRKTERTAREAADDAAARTIADRLTNRAKTQTVNVTMQDDAGDFEIPMQIPSWGLTCELTQIEAMMVDEAGRERMATIMTELSLDPSLDHEFWKNGTIGLVDMRLLIEGLTSAALKRIQEVQSFRSK
jgi:hypothetical protein